MKYIHFFDFFMLGYFIGYILQATLTRKWRNLAESVMKEWKNTIDLLQELNDKIKEVKNKE